MEKHISNYNTPVVSSAEARLPHDAIKPSLSQ